VDFDGQQIVDQGSPLGGGQLASFLARMFHAIIHTLIIGREGGEGQRRRFAGGEARAGRGGWPQKSGRLRRLL
jgi:hypothetical protein